MLGTSSQLYFNLLFLNDICNIFFVGMARDIFSIQYLQPDPSALDQQLAKRKFSFLMPLVL